MVLFVSFCGLLLTVCCIIVSNLIEILVVCHFCRVVSYCFRNSFYHVFVSYLIVVQHMF